MTSLYTEWRRFYRTDDVIDTGTEISNLFFPPQYEVE